MPSPSLPPEEFDRLCDHALALQQAGNLEAARQMYEQLLLLDPRNSGLMINLASIHSAYGQPIVACELLEASLKINPQEAYAHFALGHALLALQRVDEAVASYTHAIALQPQANFYTARGVAHYANHVLDAALADHQQAIALQPDHAAAHNNRGNVLAHLKRQPEALASYERACELQPVNAIFWCNRGAMLHYFKRDAEALACYQRALKLDPQSLEAWINQGTLLGDMRHFDKALASFDRAIALHPQATEAYWNKALLQLTLGHYAEGWALYESRWQKPAFAAERRNYPQPLWLGHSPIAGKTILIHPEQGFGDYIQFCRYARVLEMLGATVLLEAPTTLVPLLRSLSPTITIFETGSSLPAFELRCPLMSLPLALHTTVETIPYPNRYLSVDKAKCDAWLQRLGPKTKPRVGIVWSGSPTHINDHNRSMALQELMPLWELPLAFYALQKDLRPGEEAFAGPLQFPLQASHDFTDTAALIEAMDLIICVDTAVAHLAGALGKRTLLLLPYVPDFRWLLDREDTPWYNSVSLLRQTTAGDWSDVVLRVKERLMEPSPQPVSASLSPEIIQQTFQLALTAQQEGELEKAEKLYLLLLSREPRHLNALANLSTLYLNLGNLEQALLLIERALAVDPDQAILHYNYGKILMQAKMYAEAVIRYDRAIALQEQTAAFHSSRGTALYELARYLESAESHSRAIALDGRSGEYYNNRGNSLGNALRFQEAIADYDTAISLSPAMGDAYWNRGILKIMHGDFEAGFKDYEWRWQCKHFKGDISPHPQPVWLGDTPIEGKTILVYFEQGLGDVVQFSRYIPLLEAQGAKVIFLVQPSLVALIRSVSPTVTIVTKADSLPPFDLQCPIMSLPLALSTTVETIPNTIPYLSVAPEKIAAWEAILGPKTQPRIGLVWSGSPTHANDHNRSLALEQLAPLWQLPIEIHALQKDVRATDEPFMPHLHDHRQELQDFTDTAALIETMDLVISVDTSVAHVAGALGKPLWLLLPQVPDYRWLLGRDDTPWYPQARLFRQPALGDWTSVVAEVTAALKTI